MCCCFISLKVFITFCFEETYNIISSELIDHNQSLSTLESHSLHIEQGKTTNRDPKCLFLFKMEFVSWWKCAATQHYRDEMLMLSDGLRRNAIIWFLFFLVCICFMDVFVSCSFSEFYWLLTSLKKCNSKSIFFQKEISVKILFCRLKWYFEGKKNTIQGH